MPNGPTEVTASGVSDPWPRSLFLAEHLHLGSGSSRDEHRTTAGLAVSLAALIPRAAPRDHVRADRHKRREPPVHSCGRRVDPSGTARAAKRDRAPQRTRASGSRSANRLEGAAHRALPAAGPSRRGIARTPHEQHPAPGRRGDLTGQAVRPGPVLHGSYSGRFCRVSRLGAGKSWPTCACTELTPSPASVRGGERSRLLGGLHRVGITGPGLSRGPEQDPRQTE